MDQTDYDAEAAAMLAESIAESEGVKAEEEGPGQDLPPVPEDFGEPVVEWRPE